MTNVLPNVCQIDNDCPYVFADDYSDVVSLDSTNINNTYHVLHLNIRSYFKNIDGLLLLLDELLHYNVMIDAIMLCETYVNNSNIQLVHIPGFTCYNKNREERQGGGVMVFVCNHVKLLEILDTPFNDTTESLLLRIKDHDRELCLGEIYRIPNTCVKSFEADIKSILSKTVSYKTVVFGSDHNLDLLKYHKHRATDKFLCDMTLSGLLPVIMKPTRVTHESSTLIDNIFYKGQDKGIKSFVLIEDLSDHYQCLLRIDNVKRKCNDRVIFHRKLNDSAFFKLNQKLLFHDWNTIYDLDANLSYEYLVKTIMNYLDEVAPLRQIFISGKDYFVEPWMNVKLCKYKRKCKSLFSRARLHTDEQSYDRYKRYRQILNKLKRFEKRTFYATLFNKVKNDTRTTWSILNSLMKKVNNKTDTIELSVHGRKIADPSTVCNTLNEHFSSIGLDTQKQISHVKKNPLDYVTRVENAMLFDRVSEIDVSKIVDKMQNKFSSGVDGISNNFLKRIINSIRTPLCYVINCSLLSGTFPEQMKIAKVRALFKSGNMEILDNYRPISLLPVISKIIEKLGYLKLTSHMEINHITYPKQFGFRKGHSTSDAFLLSVAEVLNSFTKDFALLAVYIDLKKAFDTVDHEIILLKLEKIGVRGVALEWFKSYLCNRKQKVVYGEYESSLKSISTGVPQGSLLGVVLFMLQINDLNKSLRFSSSLLYADDTSIYVICRNIRALKTKIQHDINSLSVWLGCNKLLLNVDKTKSLLFSRSTFANVDLWVGNKQIESVKCFKFLGFYVDSMLSFEHHL